MTARVVGAGVVLAVLTTLGACGVSVPSTGAAATSDPPNGTALPSCPTTDQGPWATDAAALVTAGYPERAEEVYRAVLQATPTNTCAALGLAAVTVAEKSASASASASAGLAQRVGTTWADEIKQDVTPLGPPATAWAALLLVLLVLSRLVTPAAISPHFVSWSNGRRRTVWRAGLAVLVVAVTLLVAALALPAATVAAAVPAFIGAEAVVIVGVVGVCAIGRQADPLPGEIGSRSERATLPLLVGCGAAAVAITGVAVLAVSPGVPVSRTVVAVVLAAVLALVGVALVATGRAQALRLAVDVTDSESKPDADAGEYLVARLFDLGTRRPAGLKVPVQTDVTALPTDALTSLPSGAAAKALFALLQAVQLGIPWRATVTVHDPRTVTVELLRNNYSAGPTVTITAAELRIVPDGEPAAPDSAAEADERHRLLVAAAAYILLELSKRHRTLRNGLCGVLSWRSLALYAIATDPHAPPSRALRGTLLAAAVADDPDNAIARVAMVSAGAGDASVDGQLAVARAAERELGRLPAAEEGPELLRLRLLFARAAVLINAYLLAQDPLDWRLLNDMQEAAATLVDGLQQDEMVTPPPSTERIRHDIRIATAFLVLTYVCLVPEWLTGPGLRTVASRWCPADCEALAGVPAYDRACWRTTTAAFQPLGWQTAALDDLRVAVTDPDVREWARIDPSLANLRAGEGPSAVSYKALVGDAPLTDLLKMPMFTDHRKALRKLGLTEARDLADAPLDLLVDRTGIAPAIARRWHDVATLAAFSGMPIGLLVVVVTCGVTSVAQLQSRADPVAGTWVAWNQKVRDASASLALLPVEADWVRYVNGA